MIGPRALRAVCLAGGVALAALAASPSQGAKPAAVTRSAAPAKAAPRPAPFEFAVLGDTPYGPTEVPVLHSVLAAIGDSRAAFIIHAGNLKSARESCRDDLLTSRLSLLATSGKPLIYVPGANEWADCQHPGDGGYNPVERLDFLRDHAFNDDASLGQNTLELTRQSDMARFRQYRENVRWFYQGIVFVGLNLPGNNNNYRNAGGRNGEYEDRVIATRVWLQHALVYAEQRKVIGMVIVAQADPAFEPGRGGGLRGLFSERHGADGYRDFRTQLQKVAARFKGPILLIDGGRAQHISQPLRDARGNIDKTFTHVNAWGSPNAGRWTRVVVDARSAQLFKVESAQLPAGTLPSRSTSSGNGGNGAGSGAGSGAGNGSTPAASASMAPSGVSGAAAPSGAASGVRGHASGVGAPARDASLQPLAPIQSLAPLLTMPPLPPPEPPPEPAPGAMPPLHDGVASSVQGGR